jgi:hypothetical protein
MRSAETLASALIQVASTGTSKPPSAMVTPAASSHFRHRFPVAWLIGTSCADVSRIPWCM